MSAPRTFGSRARGIVAGAVVAVASASGVSVASAQPHLEISGSGGWWGGYDLGSRRPTITGPQTPTGSPVAIFESDITLQSGPAAEVRVGWRVWRGVYAEATGGYASSTLEARVTNDLEDAPDLTVSSSLMQVTIEGGAVVELPALGAGRHLVPFVSGGAGHLRQVHEDRVLVETGTTLYAGGGVKWRVVDVNPKGFVQRLFVRGDLRFVSRTGGTGIDDERRNYITVSAGAGVRLF
jgi:opacity protein-like surface antigen